VLEFGVARGDSIRWLHERFPSATIFGCDILNIQPTWPQTERVHYHRVDQGSPSDLRRLFGDIGVALDLIIEDGSHFPIHQRNCLVEGIRHVRPGGLYILEDIHTSHPRHPLFLKSKPPWQSLVGPLHVVLALEHLKSAGRSLSSDARTALTTKSLFSPDDIDLLLARIDRIEVFRRALLPLTCFRCGQDVFSYDRLECQCGMPLYAPEDSMSAAIHVI
jgi:hypothetical protein